MIRRAEQEDRNRIYGIINDAAIAYRGVIPDDRWHEPYMTMEELQSQIDDGVEFFCYVEEGTILGVMGIQKKDDVDLIRHAYVVTSERKKGIGSQLLTEIVEKAQNPILIGTWKAAHWAIHFYEKHGFTLVSEEQKTILLEKYWKIPSRQVETSVVLADASFLRKN